MILTLVLGAIVVYSAAPNPGHDGVGVTVNIPGLGDKSLQQAVNDNDFVKNNLVVKDIKVMVSTVTCEAGWTKVGAWTQARGTWIANKDGTQAYDGILCIKYGA